MVGGGKVGGVREGYEVDWFCCVLGLDSPCRWDAQSSQKDRIQDTFKIVSQSTSLEVIMAKG